jgi:hypothetical protein
MGEMINYTKFWSENLKRRDHSENLVVEGKTILKWILGKLRWEVADVGDQSRSSNP